MTDPPWLVGSDVAAEAIGVNRSTLWRWWKEGVVTPAWVTPKGRARWDLDELRRQIGMEAPVIEPATSPEHQPVAAAIVTSDLGALVGRRNDKVPPWTFISGEIEPGESSSDAAVREVKEETGLVVVAAAREIGRRIHPHTGRLMIYLQCAPTESLEVHVGDPDELAEVRWVASFEEIDALMPGMFEPVRDHLRRTLA